MKKFDTFQLAQDFEAFCRRKRISRRKACTRMGLSHQTMGKILNNTIASITVHSLAKILDYMNQTDVNKYIIEE